MKNRNWLALVALLLLGACQGGHYDVCYGNDSCDPGLACVYVVGHGRSCLKDEDIRVATGYRSWNVLGVTAAAKGR